VGNVYIAGGFQGSVDFDPTRRVDNRRSRGKEDIFVTMFKPDGRYGWTVTIGGPGSEIAEDVAVDPTGDIVIVGEFGGDHPPYRVDFDPTSRRDIHTATGATSWFVTKLRRGGRYAWTRTSEGRLPHRVQPSGVAIDSSGNVLFTGTLTGTVDFDPTEGVDDHVEPTNWAQDVFVTKLGADGSYGWTRSFGARQYEWAGGIATDKEGNVWVTGTTEGRMDVPGWGSVPWGGGPDAFIAALTPTGDYREFYTIGGETSEFGFGVTVDAHGNALFTGAFGPAISGGSATTDLDPTTGVDLRASVDGTDVFVIKVDANQRYYWGYTTGGFDNDFGRHIIVQPPDTSNSSTDQQSILLQWTRPYCQNGGCVLSSVLTRLSEDGQEGPSVAWDPMLRIEGLGRQIAADAAGNVLLTGSFTEVFVGVTRGDFDPTTGRDIHRLKSRYSDVFAIKLHIPD
jgi:hypothetical protein